ncbi:MAG TPA: DUF2231 domain-containing protein [Isosphaeraceae bacterium]|jgi:uncharacterized membrane protein|nr:DUF2231 domain-containing protein [Isosphaeraceae bacterium]
MDTNRTIEAAIRPVEPWIDKVEEALGHSPHPAIVALPLGAVVVSNTCDVLGMLTGGEAYDDAARLGLGIGLVGAVGAAVTGLRDYSFIPRDRPSRPVATTHGIGNGVATALLGASYVLRSLDHGAGRRPRLTARLLALAGGGLSLYTAWLGGVLVEEYGEAVKPVMERQGDDEESGRDRLDPDSPLGRHESAEA